MKRVARQQEPKAPSVDREGGGVTLRLAIGKDGLGLELARPIGYACLELVEIVVRLPHVRFPFDVSGGVGKFRHRRGELDRLRIELDARRVARFAEPRLRGLLGPGPCVVTIAPRAWGATVTVATSTPRSALAFEVTVLPAQNDVAVVVHGARGANLRSPATALAIRGVAAFLGAIARREGSRFVILGGAEALTRRILPDAGARAPNADGVTLVGCGENDGVMTAVFSRRGTTATLSEESTRASEAATLARDGDDAMFSGDYERARALHLATLERAPRHPELAKRIAEIDAHTGNRAEAAAATLRGAANAPHVGDLLGAMLLEVGDRPGALAALLREGERDPSGPVSALLYATAATHAESQDDALAWLDQAVARAPRIAEIRWERAERRLFAGRLEGARADVQELEALANGPRERHDVLRQAADLYRHAGLGNEAAALYERALLYSPDDPVALAGLGAAIAEEGRVPRGAALLASAIEAAGERSLPTSWMQLLLARLLGERLGDRPAAIARLRAIPDDATEAIEARGLEGKLRGELGDAAGASLAFARMRERAGNEPSAVSWLLVAASFEEQRGDLASAQRHLATANAITPQDANIEARYRAIGALIAERAGLHAPAPAAAPEAPAPAPTPAPAPAGAALPVPPELDEAEAEARVESLTRTLQGDPTNDAVVDELVVHLTRLGRGMDLLALLSARLEEAPADRRAILLPKHVAVLEHLESEARKEGRLGEADLFQMAREAAS